MSWIQLAIALLNRRKKKEIKLNLDMIVFHEQLSVLFLQHCTSELCAENYLFYKEAKKWKSESTKEDKRYLREHARVIYATYLSSKSPFEINIAGSVRDELVKQIKKGNENDSLPENLFDDALLEIRELITRDTLPRFYTSKEFQEKVMKTDLIDQLHNDMERRKASAVSPSGVLHRAISMRIS